MPTTGLNFSAQIGQWCDKVEGVVTAIRNDATEEVADLMRSYTPVEYGFLAGTIQASLNAPTPIDPTATNESKQHLSADASAGEISLTISNASLMDVIYICFTMAYAVFVNFGTSKMSPRAMVQRAAEQWPAIVDRSVAKAKARLG